MLYVLKEICLSWLCERETPLLQCVKWNQEEKTFYQSEISKFFILGPTTLTVESGAFTISSTIGTVSYLNNKICKLLENYVRKELPKIQLWHVSNVNFFNPGSIDL